MEGVVEAPSGKGRQAENFPVGSLLIRPALRPHIHAFYDFARNADDIADSPTLTSADKLDRLDRMEAVLLGHERAGAPSAVRLRESLVQTGVTATHSQDLLAAFRQDSVQRRIASWDALMAYCRLSAMPVGRHVLDLHGETRRTWPASDALCASLQILNHLQDCVGDLVALDRCYLPEDLMAMAGASTQDLLGEAETPGLRLVFAILLDRCAALNAQAADLPASVADRRLRLETAVIAGLAKRLTRRLRADPIATRVKLRPFDVAGSLAGALAYLPAPRPA